MDKVGCLALLVHLFFLVADCSHHNGGISGNKTSPKLAPAGGVHLQIQGAQVVMSNGLVTVTLSNPAGMVTGIQYGGINNVLETANSDSNRGYWDVVWARPGSNNITYDNLSTRSFKVIVQNDNQVEISFTRTWSNGGLPLNVDKRFIMLRGSSGFYSYAIFEHSNGMPEVNIDQARIVFKIQENNFRYMAISDQRQRIMPTAADRITGQPLDYPEAVRLTNPRNTLLKGEVDDKYQYSCENKDNRVHGWISETPSVGFWMITPSNEFRNGGPHKQDLTSHVGPTVLSMFVSTHYAGEDLGMKFRNGEAWKKVFGPVFIYLNSASNHQKSALWQDAKSQMMKETENWPYNFPQSPDFLHSNQRGSVSGQLSIRDGGQNLMPAASAYVGLALPGNTGSWEYENKGYQFWSKADGKGNFLIKGIRPGSYNLFAWIPGTIGDYKYGLSVTITPGSNTRLSNIVYEPPRNGPTLWEIGVADRVAAEFFVPDPNPSLVNHLYKSFDKFRQYGLWNRYTEIYPRQDLVYTVGVSNYRRDWFFAHVTRYVGNGAYSATTWQILFDIKTVSKAGNYTLRVALASAHEAELQVRANNQNGVLIFTTGLIGRDNAIARHGIRGLYWLYSVGIPGSKLNNGRNTIFLTQARGSSPFRGVMYDYIRLEGPR
ncbi:probable rhamnogalacturonate lyase B isoform X2 [Actinidia eriantha]|uniref:probable rhamnogalacturonate lyase B isoform X2 n=1 Tax=Actinidia eriantha TaxID=165200 RepID=UPI0025873FD4|nr:probable rhamnogalacturonate lyase B isoform X2 [Actinidia eriantha]